MIQESYCVKSQYIQKQQKNFACQISISFMRIAQIVFILELLQYVKNDIIFKNRYNYFGTLNPECGHLRIFFRMGRKTKIIAKQASREKSISTSQQPLQSEVLVTYDIFSENFKQRIDQFHLISKELQTMKTQAQHNEQNDSLNNKRDQTSVKIEEAIINILNEQLKSLGGWIVEQQKRLMQDIDKINKVYEEAKSNLVAINVFSQAEITEQLVAIKKKADEKKQIHDHYSELLVKFKIAQEAK